VGGLAVLKTIGPDSASSFPPWYRNALHVVAACEALLALLLLIGWRTPLCGLLLGAAGLAFLAWDSVLAPKWLAGRNCGCLGPLEPGFVARISIGLAITLAGTVLWWMSAPARVEPSVGGVAGRGGE
jgi:hypothetical protein